MYTHTIQSSHKSNRLKILLLICCFAILSVYPIYRNFYYSNGLETYERHRAVIEKRSEFYNPWQYRIFCPYIVEAGLWIYNNTVDKIFPIEQKLHFSIQSTSGTSKETDELIKIMQTPGAMKYMVIFVLFRFAEHLVIFCLAWRLWRYFVQSKMLIFLGLNFLTLSFGNAVAAADLSFNTYMDIIFYLLTSIIIVYKKNPLWLLPITIFGAFNRETSILIPALYFISQTDFTRFSFSKLNVRSIGFPGKKTWLYVIALYAIFFCIFIALRIYFGYKPQQEWKAAAGLPMLRLNLVSAVGIKAYMELVGTFAVLPLLIIYKFRSLPHLLKKWFLFIVPIWFAVHYLSVVAYQTRLFMVPLILIIFPMMLWLVEKEIMNKALIKTEA